MLDMGFEPEVRSILSQTCSGMIWIFDGITLFDFKHVYLLLVLPPQITWNLSVSHYFHGLVLVLISSFQKTAIAFCMRISL